MAQSSAVRKEQTGSQAADAGSHGTFCWNELMTHDVEAAKKFYKDVVGWSFESMPIPGNTYWVAKKDDKRVGGMFPMSGPDFKNVPEHWVSYIAVDDVDARVRKAEAAGASVIRAPFDIPHVGRIAILHDKGGAAIAMITPNPS